MGGKSSCNWAAAQALVCACFVLVFASAALGTPYFLIDSEFEWNEARMLDHVKPVSNAEWQDYMMQWDAYLEEGEPYPPNMFLPPRLYVWPGGGGGGLDPEDAGLVMVWGDAQTPPGEYSSAWKYDYLLDPDLTNCTITLTVTAPQFDIHGNQINVVSFGIMDMAGAVRSWQWSVGLPGSPIQWNVPTTITINTALLGVGAATPVASGFMNNPAFNIVNSQFFIVDENSKWVGGSTPVPPPGGQTGMWNYWHNVTVTPNIPPKFPDPLKWSQPPVEVDPNILPPLFYGWDEQSVHHYPPLCADDWECVDPRPVTDVHWWGSFVNWTQPYLPPQVPRAFHIGIWTDVPAEPPFIPFSHPGTMIWEHVCDTFTWNFAGYDKDPRGLVRNEACFQFHQYLPNDKWFYQDPGPAGRNVYWLSIAAIYDFPDVQYPWGWKTRPHYWNDDAVRIWQVTDPAGVGLWPPHVGWQWAQGEPIMWQELSWDLAFELTTTGPVEQIDWGDAPDPTYPTLAANSGASHVVVPGLLLGNLIDAEPDGQPTFDAMGDDNNNLPDEDGVVFNQPLIPGQLVAVTVNAAIPSAASAYLNAWIDFDANGSWADPGEQIAVDVPVNNGPNFITFTVPPTSPPGAQTYARFRLSTIPGLSYMGAAPDGEVEDYQVGIGYKWVQKPDLSVLGIDVNATHPHILADDFECTVPGPITDVHVWGSWRDDILPLNDPHQVTFVLSIHKDIPARISPTGYSMPGDTLWIRQFQPGEFVAFPYATGLLEGWMDPPDNYFWPGDTVCWRYDFFIPEAEAFYQQGNPDEPVVYWLNVQAFPMDELAKFGWKTSLDHWNDDAVWGIGSDPYSGTWWELIYPPQHELAGQSIDLAFAITGKVGTPPVGTLSVKYNHNIADHFWWPAPAMADNEMISIVGGADAVENIFWTDITLQAFGSGNDAFDINAVRVWADNDNDGSVSPGDTLIGTGAYPVDDGSVTIALAPPPLVPANGTFPLVVSYVMNASAPVGATYQFNVVGASGIGQTSGAPVTVNISPLPLVSAKKIVGLRPISIGEAKKLPIGQTFLLEKKICTGNFLAQMGLFYIEEPDRSAGIGVMPELTPPSPINVWDRVSVLGVCQLINNSELVVVPQQTIVTPGIAPPMGSPRFPVGMNNKWTGGGWFGGQPGVWDDVWAGKPSYGLSNVGMLITTWGKVTYHQVMPTLPPIFPPMVPGDMFWIDDGSVLKDGFQMMAGAPTVGVGCWVPSPYPGLPNPGEYWGVTGILRAIPAPWGILPTPVRMLIPRTAADMIRYNP